MIQEQIGHSGLLAVRRLSVSSLDDEDHLLSAALDDKGRTLHPEFCEKLFQVDSRAMGGVEPPAEITASLERRLNKLQQEVFDMKFGLEAELKDLAQHNAIKQAYERALTADRMCRDEEAVLQRLQLEYQLMHETRITFSQPGW
jgi:hypothetical protein